MKTKDLLLLGAAAVGIYAFSRTNTTPEFESFSQAMDTALDTQFAAQTSPDYQGVITVTPEKTLRSATTGIRAPKIISQEKVVIQDSKGKTIRQGTKTVSEGVLASGTKARITVQPPKYSYEEKLSHFRTTGKKLR